MKQKAQWLSQVWRASNRAEWTSTPMGSPAAFSMATVRTRPPRSISSSTAGPSVSRRHRIRSRGGSPSTATTSSPTANPARDAGDAGATATIRGRDMAYRLRGKPR